MSSRELQRCLLLTATLMGGLGCDRSEARAAATYVVRPNLPVEAFQVTLDDGSSSRTFRGSELVGTNGSVSTPEIGTKTGGTLQIGYGLNISGVVVSEGIVQLPLHGNWTWGATIQVDSVNPSRYCLGCAGAKAFPLSAAYRRVAADSVWVTWGGNYITNPVIY